MVFSWFRDLHRRSILEQPFPDAWLPYLTKNVPHYTLLTPDEQAELKQDMQVFCAEKYWEGVGLDVIPEMQATIAAQACILTLHREHDYYPNVESIVLYPTGYTAKETAAQPGGVVSENVSGRLGEAWGNGPIVLSWADVLAGGRNDNDGRNVVYHEFAHKLDMRAGAANGVPRLDDDAEYARWETVMKREYELLIAASEHHRASLIDTYGATNEAEFFAVSTECFFEKGVQMRQTHADLYDVLREFYRQDPALRHAEQHTPHHNHASSTHL